MIQQKETCITYIVGDPYATYSTGENRRITKLKRQALEHPELVQILYENDDGSILAHIPPEWMPDPRPKKKVSEEQRKAMSERSTAMHLQKSK